MKSLSHVWLFVTSWTVAYQAPWSMGFSRQEYWSGLPFPSPDLPNPGIEPGSPALQTDTLPSEPPGKPKVYSLKESQMPPTKQMYNTALAQHTLYMLVGNHLYDSDRKEQRVLFLQFFKLWWNTHKISMFLPLKKFYWGIVDLQCVSFKYTVNWISYTYTLGSSSLIDYYGALNFLCYTGLY